MNGNSVRCIFLASKSAFLGNPDIAGGVHTHIYIYIYIHIDILHDYIIIMKHIPFLYNKYKYSSNISSLDCNVSQI